MSKKIFHHKPVLDLGMGHALGEFNDTLAVDKFGYNSAIGNSFETVWDGSNTYTWIETATTLNVVAEAGATDNGVMVVVEGLDADYNIQVETVTLGDDSAGGTSTTKKFYRVHRAYVIGTQDPTDDITIEGQDDTVYAQITFPYNQTLMAVYTVPQGYTAYLLSMHLSIEKNKDVVAKLMTRNPANTFNTKAIVSSYAAPVHRQWSIPMEIGPTTDIKIDAKAGPTTGVAAGFELLLVENI